MKTEMHVVSSYEISPSCTVEGGFIRVGEKSSKSHHKTVYTMDEAISKLKRVLREMKNQDRDIYRQLMTLNSNIVRLKKEIAGEEEKRDQNDMELEYDYESVDADDDSCSDFEVSDIDVDEIRSKEDSNQSSGVESSGVKDADSDSIHERYDSGIQEDASYNITPCKSASPPSSMPKRRGTTWNGERSAMYNFLLTKLPSSDDSRENSDEEEQSKSKIEPKVWDQVSEKHGSTDSGTARGNDGGTSNIADQIQPCSVTEEVTGGTERPNLEQDAANADRLKEESSVEQGDEIKRQLGQTSEARPITRVHAKRIVKHRRTQSEDRFRPDLNGNYLAKGYILNAPVDTSNDAHKKRDLEYICENEGKGSWNAFDVRNYQASERLIRREIPPIRGIRINQQLLVPDSYEKKLNGSLTQLNIDGAISSNAIRAIERSSSSSNCASLTGDEMKNTNFIRSWTMPRKMENEIPSKSRVRVRSQKTASAYLPNMDKHLTQQSGLEVVCAHHSKAMVSSTVSLV